LVDSDDSSGICNRMNHGINRPLPIDSECHVRLILVERVGDNNIRHQKVKVPDRIVIIMMFICY